MGAAVAVANVPLVVSSLRISVADEATGLNRQLILVRKLHHDRVRRLSFMTPEAMEREDKLIRQEKADRVRHARERVVPPGYTAAPGSVAVHAVLVDVHATLTRLDMRARRKEAYWPACPFPRRVPDPTDIELLNQVVAHAALTTNVPWLREATDSLQGLTRQVTDLVNGPGQARVPDPCPFCGRESLVMHEAEDKPTWVECDTDRRTGHQEDCTCWDPLCPCKARPFRHRWEGNEQLHTLAGLIRHAKEAAS